MVHILCRLAPSTRVQPPEKSVVLKWDYALAAPAQSINRSSVLLRDMDLAALAFTVKARSIYLPFAHLKQMEKGRVINIVEQMTHLLHHLLLNKLGRMNLNEIICVSTQEQLLLATFFQPSPLK